MTSVLRREEGEAYSLQQFICSNKKETPPENKDLEADFKTFLEKGICMISRTGGWDSCWNIYAHEYKVYFRGQLVSEGRGRDEDADPGQHAQEAGGRQEGRHDRRQQEPKEKMNYDSCFVITTTKINISVSKVKLGI